MTSSKRHKNDKNCNNTDDSYLDENAIRKLIDEEANKLKGAITKIEQRFVLK